MAKASLVYICSTGILYTVGGKYMMTGTLDECANEFMGYVITVSEDY